MFPILLFIIIAIGGVNLISFDHVAITVKNLEESIHFYENLGYTLQSKFCDKDYKWATLKLKEAGLELFQPLQGNDLNIFHIAYNFVDDEEAFEFAKNIGYRIADLNVFYGDLNRKSFFVQDDNGVSIQLIKKKK